MFEFCDDLRQCEREIEKNIRNVKLLGDLLLTEADVVKLNKLIKEKISLGVRNATNFFKTTPGCLSLFLVQQGIYTYDDGNFWLQVETIVGPLDVNTQTLWGDIFLNFLKAHGLLTIQDEGIKTYLTHILMHGGIPDSCLEDYFNVVYGFVKKGYDNPEFIRYDILKAKESYARRTEIQKRSKVLEDKKRKLGKKLAHLLHKKEMFEQLGFIQIQSEIAALEYKQREKILKELANSNKMRAELNEQYQRYLDKIEVYENFYKPLLQKVDYIERFKKTYTEWNELNEKIIEKRKEIEYCRARIKDMAENINIMFTNLEIAQALSAIVWLYYSLFVDNQWNNDMPINIIEKIKSRLQSLSLIYEIAKNPKGYLSYFDSFKNYCERYNLLKGQCERIGNSLKSLDDAISEIAVSIFDEEFKNARGHNHRYDALNKKIEEALVLNKEINCIRREIHEIRSLIDKYDVTIKELIKQLIEIDLRFMKYSYNNLQLALERARTWFELKQQQRIPQLIDQEVESIKKEIQDVEEQIRSERKAFDRTSIPFYVDKPILRYILFGGETAIEFFINTFNLMKNTNNGVVPQSNFNLPPRVIEAYKKWLLMRYTEEEFVQVSAKKEGLKVATSRYYKPYIFFDEEEMEVKFFIPSQYVLWDEYVQGLYIEISNQENSSKWELDAVRNGEMIISEAREFSLSFLADTYKASLCVNRSTSKGDKNIQVIKEWNIPFLNSETFTAFKWDEKGKSVLEDGLSRGKHWLLLRKDLRVLPDDIVLKKEEGFYPLDEYSFFLVDIEDGFEQITITNDDERYLIPIKQKSQIKVWIDDADIAITSNGYPVYIGKRPSIYITGVDIGELYRWRIFILCAGQSLRKEYFYLHEFKGLLYNGKEIVLRLPLEQFGYPERGYFTIILNGTDDIDYRFKFCILPDILLQFNKRLYLSNKYDAESAKLKVQVKEGQLRVVEPAKILYQNGDTYEIEVSSTEKYIYGTLWLGKQGFNLEVLVPKIEWRIEGSDQESGRWETEQKELWINLWSAESLYLCVKFPEHIKGRVVLKIKEQENGNVEEGTITGGQCRLNLLSFADTLHEVKGLLTFVMYLYDESNIPLLDGIHIFTVRTIWEVTEFKYNGVYMFDRWFLELDWKDLGKEEKRFLLIWSVLNRGLPTIIKEIPEGINHMRIDIANLLPGRYVVQFTTRGEVYREGYIYPDTSGTNVFTIDLSLGQPCLKKLNMGWDKEGFKVEGKFENVREGGRVLVAVIGSKGGKKEKSLECYINENGRFCAYFKTDISVHWVCISLFFDGKKYLFAFVVPGGDPIEVSLNKFIAQRLHTIWESSGLYVRLYSKDNQTSENLFFGDIKLMETSKFVNALLNGNKEINISLGFKDEEKTVRLMFCDCKCVIYLNNGIKCTTCGAILPDQKIWDRFHYPRCKSYEFNITQIEVFPFVIWNYDDIIENIGIEVMDIDDTYMIYQGSGKDQVLNEIDADVNVEGLVGFLLDKEINKIFALLEKGWKR